MSEILDNPLGFESEAFIPEEAHEAFARAEITASILLSMEDGSGNTRSCTLMLSVEPPVGIPYKTLNPPPSSALCVLGELADTIQGLVAEQRAFFGKAWLQAWAEEQERKQKSRKSRKKKTSKTSPPTGTVDKATDDRAQEGKAELVEEDSAEQPEEAEGVEVQADETDRVDEEEENEGTGIEGEEADEDPDDVDDESDQFSLLGGIEL
jgi:hypothetical protein